mgnify:CR=1 FL=1
MWIITQIFIYLSFAIQWFWTHYDKYKEENSIWKVALLFLCSLSGLFLTVGTFIWLIIYFCTYHTEIVVCFGLIIWLYAYVKSLMDKKAEEHEAQQTEHKAQIIEEESELDIQARKARRLVCNVLYQTLREMAGDISCRVPRLSEEIEILDMPYFIRGNLIFYQFRLVKESNLQYEKEDLEELKKMLQSAISRKIQCGDFPTLGMDAYPYGNGVYDAVMIDSFEDVGNQFIIQAVLYSPAYAEYLVQKEHNQQMLSVDNTSVPDATWREKK